MRKIGFLSVIIFVLLCSPTVHSQWRRHIAIPDGCAPGYKITPVYFEKAGKIVGIAKAASKVWEGGAWVTTQHECIEPSQNLVYDALRGMVYMLLPDAYITYMAEWNGYRYTEIEPCIDELERGYEMAYFGSRQYTLRFGGRFHREYYGRYGDPRTLSFDGVDWSVRAKEGPEVRSYHAMTWDEARDNVVLFGGAHKQADDTIVMFDDMWVFDGQAWTEIAKDGPGARFGHAMAFDEKRRVVVLFGGETADGVKADTWEWNGVTWSRAAVSAAAGDGPAARCFCRLVYDGNRGKVLMMGGRDGYTGYKEKYSDVWEWDGKSWTMLSATGPDDIAGAAYDPVRGRVVVSGWGSLWFFGPEKTTVSHASDYDGDGKAELAVFRPSVAKWFIKGQEPIQFGRNGDLPLVNGR